jgi:hypothetical protein
MIKIDYLLVCVKTLEQKLEKSKIKTENKKKESNDSFAVCIIIFI